MKSKDLLITAFVLGLVLLGWPFLTIVNQSRAVLGIPLLVLYLFVVWGGVILLLWLTQRRGAGP